MKGIERVECYMFDESFYKNYKEARIAKLKDELEEIFRNQDYRKIIPLMAKRDDIRLEVARLLNAANIDIVDNLAMNKESEQSYD